MIAHHEVDDPVETRLIFLVGGDRHRASPSSFPVSQETEPASVREGLPQCPRAESPV